MLLLLYHCYSYIWVYLCSYLFTYLFIYLFTYLFIYLFIYPFIYLFTYLFIYLPWSTAPSGPQPPYYRGLTITLRHTTLGRTPLCEGSAHRRHLYLTTQRSKQTDIHAPGGIRTHNPNKPAAADPRLRPRSPWV